MLLLLLLLLLLPLPSWPQMTRRIGKSFAQLLTNSAVLIAVGLAGVGGGRGWMFREGAVETRRNGGGCRRGEEGAWFPAVLLVVAVDVPAGRHGDEADTNGGSCCDSLDGLVNVDIVCSVTLPLFLPAPRAGTQRGTSMYTNDLTVRWCASVARAFSVRKNKYWTIIGARERKLDVAVADFSIRAQVK